MKRFVTIQIPESIDGTRCDTNGIHPVIVINGLNILYQHFCRVLVEMAEKEVGPDRKLQEQWIDRVTKKYLGGTGDLGIKDVNQFN